MSERHEAASERRCVVLFVDDYELLAIQRARNLENSGLTVHRAHDAGSALRCLAQNRIDVVVADLRLPGTRDGVSLLEEAARRWPGIGRVLCSGALTDEAREWCDREGVPIVLKGDDPPDVLPRVILRECRHHVP